ncbi:hypothetical protein [Rhizobium sp. RU36D]|uniref:hypothetical protein n=1 Tax=Rhizobium sp. RU36D TaxID=1907415 RepID=UPI0009D89594|nr:hypothetical protein [Rhizobium sp. RU36D]SMD16352.1 hypothetical protein SAMN05880593_12956 [Rhizobium sp. RU36D]
MSKKIALLPLTVEALKQPVAEHQGNALRWTTSPRQIIEAADEIEDLRVASKLPKSMSIGMEAVLLTAGPSQAYTGHQVIGSKVTYRYTKSGWRVASVARETRYPGQREKVALVVTAEQAAEIQQRSIAGMIIKQAA